MKIFKFGGASVKDAESIGNVAEILVKFSGEKIIVVVSAMGKTTNALEALVDHYFNNRQSSAQTAFEAVKKFHFDIVAELLNSKPKWLDDVLYELHEVFSEMKKQLVLKPSADYPVVYDQIVSLGEIISSKILSMYLNSLQDVRFRNDWHDIRFCVVTDNAYMSANVDWEKTAYYAKLILLSALEDGLIVTQGFIGRHVPSHRTTTLGREGSDYTAAILANCLDAEEVILWKNVPGIMSADPNKDKEAKKFDNLSYDEAFNLLSKGAKVVHPKTIKPLAEKGIPLYIKNFFDPEAPGTKIS